MRFQELCEMAMGGLSEGMSLEDIAKKHNVDIKDLEKELEMGIEVEKEHFKDNVKMQRKTAMDHLSENPKYYSKMKECGLD
jgi:hypothetical protein